MSHVDFSIFLRAFIPIFMCLDFQEFLIDELKASDVKQSQLPKVVTNEIGTNDRYIFLLR